MNVRRHRSRGWFPFAAMAVVLATAIVPDVAPALDMVTRRDGAILRGTLLSLSPEGVEIEDRSGVKKVGIVELLELAVDGEPDSLRAARRLLLRRDFRGAVGELEKLEADEIAALEPRIRQEFDFLKIAADARLAEGADAAAVERSLEEFLQRNSRSHHLYQGYELLGDLRARQGKFPEASQAYAFLERGPAALQVRAASAKAGLLLQQGKLPEAIKEFETAEKIITPEGDAASGLQKREAALGRARCLARGGKAAEGVAVARQVIRGASPAEKELLAAGFMVLGTCQRAAGGQDQDAVISFLTVDLVYNLVPAVHAEALYQLVELWNAANEPERAREAGQVLVTSYPDSPWAAKLPRPEKGS